MSSVGQSLVVAVDVGTSSVRALIFADDLTALPHTLTQTQYPSGAEMSPLAVWEGVVACLDGALARLGADPRPVTTLAMDTFAASLLGTDAAGVPLTPVYTWADTRGGEIAARLRRDQDAAAYTERTGARLHTSYWPTRLLWLAENGAIPGGVRHWLTVGEWLHWRLTGTRQISLSAAAWTGLLNRFEGAWDAETCRWLPLTPNQLSPISDAPADGLRPEWAARWPRLAAAAVFPAVGDGYASNLGSGCTGPDQVALAIGTSGALRVLVGGRPAPVPEGMFAYAVNPDQTLVGGALSNAGNLYAWLNEILNRPDGLDGLDSLPPDGHGLTVLPYLAGERAPLWDNDAFGAIVGLTLSTRPEQIVQAGLEAVAYRYAALWERIRPLVGMEALVVASGGPTHNAPQWMQMIADALGAPVATSTEPDATVRGAAAHALHGALGMRGAPRLGRVFTPRPAVTAVYAAAAARQTALYRALRPASP